MVIDRYNSAMTLDQRIVFIGAGNMTEALVAGLLKAEIAPANNIFATDIVPARREHMKTRFGIEVAKDNRHVVERAHILILSVEPQDLDEVLVSIRGSVSPDCLIISVAAGYPIARVAEHLGSVSTIVRAMPNTPSSVLAGVTALAFGHGLSEKHRNAATTIFEAVGKVVLVNETLMDAVTGLSGSGPAYVYVIIEALADRGSPHGASSAGRRIARRANRARLRLPVAGKRRTSRPFKGSASLRRPERRLPASNSSNNDSFARH